MLKKIGFGILVLTGVWTLINLYDGFIAAPRRMRKLMASAEEGPTDDEVFADTANLAGA